ncbi:hypothetical protein [Bacteroidetes bacterium endosymbiont of Geopemphigus sp.]|uniref:P-type ATPase n=1 Tax=Bacteroidetes bacterium endosymbiont of Geopemphigus sp. TaxID=2047937 RepID=UPI0018A83BFA|nr:hypothetical protein [Bacteroidetes bacterium endosymbiont of Geopemphigus sp.]
MFRNDVFSKTHPENFRIIQVRAGGKVPLDGLLRKGFESSFNTAALTGESRPQRLKSGKNVLARMINLQKTIEIEVIQIFKESSLARVLDLV